MIRNVTLNDSSALSELYNYFIRTSGATFDEIEITQEEMGKRIKNIHFDKHFPYLVYEEEGDVIGYAYASSFRERNAYRFTVESTVYVNPKYFGKGVGKALYVELLSQIKSQGFHLVVGVITLPNEASVRLHEQMGFQKAGQLKEVGYKFEQWRDVGFWELLL